MVSFGSGSGWLYFVLLGLFAFSCGGSKEETPQQPNNKPQKVNPKEPDPENGEFTLEEATAGLKGSTKLYATIQTSMGDIKCELLPEVAPNAVANFVGLSRGVRPYLELSTGDWVKKPFYEGLTFHRVLPDFLIQGGDPTATGNGGPGYKLKDEFSGKLLFDKPGRLAMAHTPYPNSAGSQFFITEVAVPSFNTQYTIFGQCADLDIVKAIARVSKKGNPEQGRPEQDVFIKHIEISYK